MKRSTKFKIVFGLISMLALFATLWQLDWALDHMDMGHETSPDGRYTAWDIGFGEPEIPPYGTGIALSESSLAPNVFINNYQYVFRGRCPWAKLRWKSSRELELTCRGPHFELMLIQPVYKDINFTVVHDPEPGNRYPDNKK